MSRIGKPIIAAAPPRNVRRGIDHQPRFIDTDLPGATGWRMRKASLAIICMMKLRKL